MSLTEAIVVYLLGEVHFCTKLPGTEPATYGWTVHMDFSMDNTPTLSFK